MNKEEGNINLDTEKVEIELPVAIVERLWERSNSNVEWFIVDVFTEIMFDYYRSKNEHR